MATKKILLKTGLKRREGYFTFLDKDLNVCETKRAAGKKKSKKLK